MDGIYWTGVEERLGWRTLIPCDSLYDGGGVMYENCWPEI